MFKKQSANKKSLNKPSGKPLRSETKEQINLSADQSGRARGRFDHDDLKKSGFWLGHLMLIAATIVGVYLAAEQGFNKALQFDQINSMEDNYYLRRSLMDEFSDNLAVITEFNENWLSKSLPVEQISANQPELSLYVWQTMQYSPQTLETPSRFLTGIRRFYAQYQRILRQRLKKQISPSVAGQKIRQLVSDSKQSMLPDMATDLDSLSRQLKAYGLDVSR